MTRVFVSGHKGMVGSAIVRRLAQEGRHDIITRSRDALDLTDQVAVQKFFEQERIDEVYVAAAKVGGILANNTYPAEFLYDNLMIECNLIHAAHTADVQRLLFLGSSCIYPREADQPMREDALLSGVLEPTNEPYAIAKIAGIKLCESFNRQYGRDYRSVMPTNLYGPGDNFHSDNSHVIPGLMRRFHEAVLGKATHVTIWGSGTPKREFLHVNDMAAACIFVMALQPELYKAHTLPMLSHINVGTGVDCTIAKLAETMAGVTGFFGDLVFDTSKPDGTPRKLLDVSLINSLGWNAQIELEQGLFDTYQWYIANRSLFRQ